MTDLPIKISIVSPVYKAQATLEKLVDELQNTIEQLGVDYEIILVDDRSPDKSWVIMKDLASRNSRIKVVRLSRNFGQHPAIMAGLSLATGDWIVVMDCDLQDRPDEIINLYHKAVEGYDVVMARRSSRQDSLLRKMGSKAFASLFSFFSDLKMSHEVANFGIYRKKVINSVIGFGDHIKSFPFFIYAAGFESTSIDVKHSKRSDGKSGYSFWRLLKLGTTGILLYSNKPLSIFAGMGAFTSCIALIYGIYLSTAVTNSFAPHISILLVVTFFSGMIMFGIGLAGIYIGHIFQQVKGRPAYIIDESSISGF